MINDFLLFYSDSSISTRIDLLTPAIEVYKPPQLLWHKKSTVEKDETVDSHLDDISSSDLWQEWLLPKRPIKH